MINTVQHIDCLIGMQSIADKSVDMILCDLPYGTTQNKWDSVIDLKSLWLQYERIIKDNGAIVLTSKTPFDKILGSSNIERLRYEWIWQKNVATGHLSVRWYPMQEHENVLIFYKSRPTYNAIKTIGHPYVSKRKKKNDSGENWNGIVRTDTINIGLRHPKSILKFDREIGLHPTQKPVALFEYLIKTYTNEGETVLDNCAGSGTTAIACINTNRNYILMEKEEKYCKIIESRIKEHTPQLKLAI